MAKLFGKRQRQIQGDLSAYNEKVVECMGVFQETFVACGSGADRDQLRGFYDRIHRAEGDADDIRREIEVAMYTQALFPESRGDVLGLLESMDRVPNHAESSVRMLLTEHIDVPPAMCPSLNDLVQVTVGCVGAMIEGVEQLFSNFVSATVTVGKIDKLESEADRLEYSLIDTIFASDWRDLAKIQLKDLVDHIAGISDRAESVGDRIRIIVAKRSI